MSQWQSQTRKMNNHYQSAQPVSNIAVNLGNATGGLVGFRSSDGVLTTPLAISFPGATYSYTDILGVQMPYEFKETLNFNNFNSVRLENWRGNSSEENYFKGDWLVDRAVRMVPVPLIGSYLPIKYKTMDLDDNSYYYKTIYADQLYSCVVPVVDRYMSAFVFYKDSYYSNLPDWFKNATITGTFSSYPSSVADHMDYTDNSTFGWMQWSVMPYYGDGNRIVRTKIPRGNEPLETGMTHYYDEELCKVSSVYAMSTVAFPPGTTVDIITLENVNKVDGEFVNTFAGSACTLCRDTNGNKYAQSVAIGHADLYNYGGGHINYFRGIPDMYSNFINAFSPKLVTPTNVVGEQPSINTKRFYDNGELVCFIATCLYTVIRDIVVLDNQILLRSV